jgi:hypothetical protein
MRKQHKQANRRQSSGLMATSRLPLAYLNMPKSACSTIKNIMYFLETGEWFHDPLAIHRHLKEDSPLLRGRKLTEHRQSHDLERPYIAFTFVRHPGRRAYSAFIDKIWSQHQYSFPVIQKYLRDTRGVRLAEELPGPSVEDVRSAFSTFLDFAADNLAGKTPFPSNPHWQVQFKRLQGAAPRDHLAFIGRVETFAKDMTALLEMAGCELDPVEVVSKRFNEGPPPPFSYSQMVDKAIDNKLRSIYRLDYTAFAYSPEQNSSCGSSAGSSPVAAVGTIVNAANAPKARGIAFHARSRQASNVRPKLDFLCIGAQKAGTSWLMRNLGNHPNVWTPPFVKEVHYFDAVHAGYSKTFVLETFRSNINRVRAPALKEEEYFRAITDPRFAFTDAWYAHIFSRVPGDSIGGECTPNYSALPLRGIEHIQRLAPDIRFIYIIRDPYDRLLSSLRMTIHRRCLKGAAQIQPLLDDLSFLNRGDYRNNIPRWESVFEKARILYIPFGHIKNHPEQVISVVEGHLNLPPFTNYRFLERRVHSTIKSGEDLPEEAIEKIRHVVEPQRKFLVEQFGKEFADHLN